MAGSASALEAEYDAFLYAPICRESGEMGLSVVSALVRLDVDPWQEAARLARLPRDAAAKSLASLIATLPGGLPRHLDAGTIATRLIGLLPSVNGPRTLSRAVVPDLGVLTRPRTLVFLLFILFMLGLQYVIAGHRSAAPAEGSQSGAPTTEGSASTGSPETRP